MLLRPFLFSFILEKKISVLYWFLPYNKTAAAAKSLQLCPTLCDPIDGSPPGSAISHNYTYNFSLLNLPPLPHPIPPAHHRVPGWAPIAAQQLLPALHLTQHVDATFSIRPTLTLPQWVHRSILHICVSSPSLKKSTI